MTNRFSAIPAVPQTGLNEWQALIVTALKENVELLTGLRGESDLASKAVTKGQLTVADLPQQAMAQTSALGSGVTITISGTDYLVAGLSDYQKLVADVQALADDVAVYRAALQILIDQLRKDS